jgi:Mg2+-importing ATPase
MDKVQLSVSMTGDGSLSDLPLQLAYVNSALQTGTRSLLDGAVVDYARSMAKSDDAAANGYLNLDNWNKIAEVPFDSARRLLSVLVSRPGLDEKGLFITKGAVEEVLDRCIQVYQHSSSPSTLDTPDQFKPNDSPHLTVDIKRMILQSAEKANEDGLRLVAVACRSTVALPSMTLSAQDERDLVFIGFLGFLDPVKPDAALAVETLASLGVQVRILTGDAPAVAAKVARTLGILPALPESPPASLDHITLPIETGYNIRDSMITGAQLTALSGDKHAYSEAIERCLIFAKLSPHQKLEVVEALRRGPIGGDGGRAVAFLGDGVNDALAIRAADVGISVDSGTEIAKEAADVILLEKSLGVISHGVLQGRTTYVERGRFSCTLDDSFFGKTGSSTQSSISRWLVRPTLGTCFPC